MSANQWQPCDLTFSQGKKQGLFKPGVIIETIGGSVYLIGEVNELGGVCDDCPAVHPSTKIVRFIRVIDYQPKQEEKTHHAK